MGRGKEKAGAAPKPRPRRSKAAPVAVPVAPPEVSTLPPSDPPKPKRAAPRRAVEAKVEPPWVPLTAAQIKADLEARSRKPIKVPKGAMPVPGLTEAAPRRKKGEAPSDSLRDEAKEVGRRAAREAAALKGRKVIKAPPAPGEAPAAEAELPGRKPDVAMSDDLFFDICVEIAQGIPLREICRRPDMPSKSGFYVYLEDDADPDVRAGRIARYARARKLGFDDIAEEALEIADDGRNDWIERTDPENPGFEYNGEHVQRSKLRVDTRLKLLAKWDPRGYGDRVALTDGDGRPLGEAGKSASDLAIDMAKLLVAAQREAGAAAQV